MAVSSFLSTIFLHEGHVCPTDSQFDQHFRQQTCPQDEAHGSTAFSLQMGHEYFPRLLCDAPAPAPGPVPGGDASEKSKWAASLGRLDESSA